jgi:ribose-phosphate pyrophosphokinase
LRPKNQGKFFQIKKTMSAIKEQFKVFSGTNSRYLAEKICDSLGCPLGKMKVEHFSDGEFSVSYEESIRGVYVFLIQSTFPSSDNLMELLLMIDAAKRASAYKTIAVIPYFGWARQDRKDKPRVSIGAKLIADVLSVAGVDRVITMDLHADQIQGFFNVPVDHLYGSTIFVPYIKSLKLENMVIASPDVGGSKRAGSYAKHLNVPMVLGYKTREKANVVSEMRIIGDVEDKNVIIVDDMVDTAGTLCKAASLIMDNGAKSVRALVTHGVMSGDAIKNINSSVLSEIIYTDSIPFDQSKSDKVKVLTIADMFADTIQRVLTHKSISEMYLL